MTDGSANWMEADLRVERDGLETAEEHYRDRLDELDNTEETERDQELAKLSRVRQLRELGDYDE